MNVKTMTILAGAALAVGVMAAPKAALAQNIKFEVKVKGYSSSGWVEVRDGQNVGGRVVRDASGTWTDRAGRGESLRVSISDPRAKKCQVQESIVGVVADNGFVRGAVVRLPLTRSFTVSRDTSFDNVTVVVLADGRVATRRVPIGTR